MSVMRLGYVHINVTDLAESKKHYIETLGMDAVHEEDVADHALVSAASVLAHVLLLIETLMPDPDRGQQGSGRQ